MEEPKKVGAVVGRMATAVLAAVIAPVVAGVVLLIVQRLLLPPPDPGGRGTAPHPTPPPPPTAAVPIQLFNGQNLDGFDTYLGVPYGGKEPYGLNKDPEKVFTIKAGELHVSGKVFGGLVTRGEYDRYRLTVEYKWGETRWPPRNSWNGSAALSSTPQALPAPSTAGRWRGSPA